VTTDAPGHLPYAEDDPLAAGEAGGKVIRGSGLRAAAHVTGVLVGALSAPLVVRHLGPVRYGQFITVTSLIYIVNGLTEGGLTNVAIRRFAVADPMGRRVVIANLSGLRIALTVIGLTGALIFGLAAGYPSIVVAGIALGGIAMLFVNLQGALATALVAGLRLKAVAAIDLTRSLTTTVLFLALVVAGSGLLGFYGVAGAVAFIVWVVTAWLVRRELPLVPRFERTAWMSLLRETALYAAATALGAVYFQVAVISMSLLSSDTQTGYYAAAFRIVDLANGVPWILASSAFPVLAHAALNDSERLRYTVGRTTQAALIVGGFFALIIVIGAKFGIQIIGGDKFAPSVSVLRILGIGTLATFLVATWSFVLLSLKRYRELLIVNAGALALAIALSLIFIPWLGANGGAIVTATLEVTLATAYGVVATRHERGLIGLHAGFVARVAGALAVGLGVGVLLLQVHAVPAVAGSLVVYVGVLWVLGAIPPELLEAVRRRRPA
jgi:O-antigen/teichoic acid export membrane protein